MKRAGGHSLWARLFVVILLCVGLLLGVNLLLNNIVMPSYYRREKVKALESAFYQIDEVYTGKNNFTLQQQLLDIGDAQSISITIWEGASVVFQDRPDELRDPYAFTGMTVPGRGKCTVKINAAGEDDQYIRLLGRLSNGYIVSMRAALTSIERSTAISNRFLLYSGLITLAVGAVAVLFVSRRLTRPIRRLSKQAVAVAGLDFSERYTAKGRDELHELGQSLNAMSDALERTIAQLQEENRRQQQQNEARRAFIANVSHELKTPIALIQNYAEALGENVAADQATREAYCAVIEDESQRMSGLIQKLLALMQLEGGSEPVERERFDLSELVGNLVEKYRPEFDRRRVRVTLPPSDPVFVWADGFLIENVLVNYLSNARHHVPEGGEVAVSLAPAGERVRVTVFNSGSTIPAEDIPRIWESFYKVDKAHTRTYGGSGLGLSLVAAIMKMHDAPYGVEVFPDGVAFYIELPLAGEEP
ncbi:MAG: HAMP domain-containing histidine kinase [Clostridia bacterium]|nr:HAMP domain-containing histidine kinase [Clostridia bacterium]